MGTGKASCRRGLARCHFRAAVCAALPKSMWASCCIPGLFPVGNRYTPAHSWQGRESNPQLKDAITCISSARQAGQGIGNRRGTKPVGFGIAPAFCSAFELPCQGLCGRVVVYRVKVWVITGMLRPTTLFGCCFEANQKKPRPGDRCKVSMRVGRSLRSISPKLEPRRATRNGHREKPGNHR